jgi:hypothetical protein
MKRFKLYVLAMVALLGFGYFYLATNPPELTRPVFKGQHWTLPTGIDVREIGAMDFRAFDRNGKLLWEELDRQNNLADDGEYMFLDVVLRAGTAPSNYYLRLYNATVVDTNNLTSIAASEASGNGYTAQTVTRNTTGWPTLTFDSGDYRAMSATQTFTASGGSWGPVTYCVLATSTDSSGKLVSYVALSQSRTLASGESLQVTYRLKLQ